MSVLDTVELAFVTGKGGVGKSTVALAAALAAARDGRRVVLCEVAGQARAARLYGIDAPRPGREAQLEDGLWSTTIDPVVALEEWAGRQIGSRRLVGLLTHSNAFAAFVNAAPGARELVAITKAWELGQSERWVKGRDGYDLVVSLYLHVAGSVEAMVRRMAAGVAPGGTLLMVGHHPAGDQVQVSVDDAVAALAPDRWEIVIAEDRPRAAAGTGVDAVIRARNDGADD